jgi:ATPase subunit of ABC transporter with duplicated ATPase domains
MEQNRKGSGSAVVTGAAVVLSSAYLAIRYLRSKTVDVRLAVVGQEGVGKSTLIARIMGETLTTDPLEKSRKDVKIQIDGGRYRVHCPVDHGGSKHDWGRWKEAVKASSKVVYVISARHLEAEDQAADREEPTPDTRDRRTEDAEQLQLWMNHNSDKSVVLVVTHTDTDSRCNKLGRQGYDAHLREQLTEIINLIGGDKMVSLVSGSLVDDEDAIRIVHEILGAGR